MKQIRFPHALEVDWTLPAIPRPNGLKQFSERKVCARVVLGQAALGDYDCFDMTSVQSGDFGRFGLSLAEGNYIALSAEIAGVEPFENGTPFMPFDRLPASLRAHFAAGGRLFWSKTYSVSVVRQWHRLHAEFHLRPGETPVHRTISQAEGVALSRAEIAARIATWERLRDAAHGIDRRRGMALLDLEELGREIERVVRRGERNATGHEPGYRTSLALTAAKSNTFVRAFAAPGEAPATVDETYNQLREIIEFHQIWFISATPFDIDDGLMQPGVFCLTLPLHAGSPGTNEIINDMDIFEVRHFTQA